MAFDYSGLARLALAQIRDKGESAILTRKGSSSFDPSTSQFTSIDETQQVQVLQVSDTSSWRDMFGANGEAAAGTLDRSVLVGFLMAASGVSIEPRGGDILTVGSTSHIVEKVQAVAPGPTTLFWRVLARSG